MRDCFATFGVVRRPALNDDLLKEKFLQLAAASHPDAADGDAKTFQMLQECRATLLEPASRLRHLAELEFGPSEDSSAPARVGLFLEVGAVLREAKLLQERLEKSRTSLARALLAKERESVLKQMRSTTECVAAVRAGLEKELILLDSRWVDGNGRNGRAVRNLASDFAYVKRWQAELAEAEFRLLHGKTA